MKKIVLTLCLIAVLINMYANDDKKEVQASLTSVTVYCSGAEI